MIQWYKIKRIQKAHVKSLLNLLLNTSTWRLQRHLKDPMQMTLMLRIFGACGEMVRKTADCHCEACFSNIMPMISRTIQWPFQSCQWAFAPVEAFHRREFYQWVVCGMGPAAAWSGHQDCEDFLGRGVDLQRLLQQLGAPRGGFVENLGKSGDLWKKSRGTYTWYLYYYCTCKWCQANCGRCKLSEYYRCISWYFKRIDKKHI